MYKSKYTTFLLKFLSGEEQEKSDEVRRQGREAEAEGGEEEGEQRVLHTLFHLDE